MKHFLRNLSIAVLSMILLCSLVISVGCGGNFCTVTFDVDGGSNVESIKIRQNTAIGRLPDTAKDGFEFLGWSDEKGGNVNVDKSYIVAKDIILYAVFTSSSDDLCAVTYVTSGTSVSSTTVKKGEPVGTLPFTDKQGYVFYGWFFDKDLTKPVYSEDVITQDTTLYAAFEAQNVESVLPEYTELSMTCDELTYEVEFSTDVQVDERNIDKFVSVTALYGTLPKIAVSTLADGNYALTPVGGYKNGGVYKFEIVSDGVEFVNINAKYDDDYTDKKVIKTLYLSVYAADEEVVAVKSDVLEVSRSLLAFSDTEDKFTAPKAVYDNLPFGSDTIVHVVDDKEDLYIKITGVKKTDDEYEFTFEDCDSIDEVYDDFDINVGDVSVPNEKTAPENKSETDKALAQVVKDLYKSDGTKAITKMLASALNASSTVRTLTGESDNPYRDKITDEQGKTFTLKGLLDDLEIKVSLGTAVNPNFNGIGISPFDDTRWTMLAITFNYETEVKNKVKLESTITIKQYVYVGLAASANKSTGNFKAEITPYSQTDLEFKILVCSFDGDDEGNDKGDKKEEKKDISVEIENLASGKGDSSNIIKDVQEMLENKGDAVELCKVPMFTASYSVGGVLSINFDLNFVIKVSFAAGVKIDATLLEATTIGVTGNYKTKTVDCYRRSAQGSDRYIFDFYAYGYLGIKAGIEGELTVSFTGLKSLFRAGLSLEVGAYADLYGYLHYHAEERRVFKDIDTNGRHFQTLEGGVYFESGIYIEIGAFVGVGKKEYGVSKEFKFALLQAGDKYLYVESCDNDDLTIVFNQNENNSVGLQDLIPAEGKFLDITTGDVEIRVIPSKNIKLISDTNLFRIDNENNLLVANMDKITQRLSYGIPYGKISLYYKGPNILFSSAYIDESIPELKGFKQLCQVTVAYLPEGMSLEQDTDFGKEVTVTYKVKSDSGEQIVKTEKVVAGQYYNGNIPDEIVSYCRKNGLLTEIDGTAVTYDGFTSGKHIIKEDTTFVFKTVEAQRFIAVRYKSQQDFASETDSWTVDIMAMNYNQLPAFLQQQSYLPQNVYAEYFVVTPDGSKKVMGNEYLSKYDLYMRGTHGYETGKVLKSVRGTEDEIEAIFGEMKNGRGELKEYAEFFTYTIQTEYITGMHTVYFYAPDGDFGQENVRYGETYKVPDYWINNINQSTSERLVGWDIDGDKKADILPNQQFTVTRDLVLRPILTSKGYTLTIVDKDGNETQHVLDAGSKIPSSILDVINSFPETPTLTDEGSFYSESCWRVLTTDFVAGDDNTAYFKGVTWKYYGDITTMPSCDIVFTAEKGELYHYVTIVNNADGYFTYVDDSGATVQENTIKIAVKDGGTVGTSKDYNTKAPKYHAPEGVSYFASNYVDENGEMLDFYQTVITEAKTFTHTIWARYDGTYTITFEYYIHSLGSDVVCERKHRVTGVSDKTKIDMLTAEYDNEYDLLTSQAYYDSLSNEEFVYSVYGEGSWNVKQSSVVDGYGVTHIYYGVHVYKQVRTYTVTMVWDAADITDYTRTVKYGGVFFTVAGQDKTVRVEEENGVFDYYYKLVGYDIDGDGVVDVLPGEILSVTSDITVKAVWSDKPYSSSRVS